MKTIKQIADELGVSKTAIRKKLTDDFRELYVETTTNGTILISEEGQKLLESLRKPPETTANLEESSANLLPETGLQSVIDVLREQIDTLKEQLDKKDEQINTLQKLLDQEQLLHNKTQSTLLALENKNTSEPSEEYKKIWPGVYVKVKK